MSTVTLQKETVIHTYGDLPEIGSQAPEFTLVKPDLSEITLSSLKGKKVVLNIFPSLDTSTCATSVRTFNKQAASFSGAIVLAVSADLPFAGGRFCTTEGIQNVFPASVFRNPEFSKDYGILMLDGPLKGLLARSVVVIDESGKVIYTQLVPEIVDEPDYDAALAVLK